MTCLRVVLCLVVVTACTRQPKAIQVTVSAAGNECEVSDQSMPCTTVGNYLNAQRHVPLQQPITLLIEGPRNIEMRGRQVRDVIAGEGYTRIFIVGVGPRLPGADE